MNKNQKGRTKSRTLNFLQQRIFIQLFFQIQEVQTETLVVVEIEFLHFLFFAYIVSTLYSWQGDDNKWPGLTIIYTILSPSTFPIEKGSQRPTNLSYFLQLSLISSFFSEKMIPPKTKNPKRNHSRFYNRILQDSSSLHHHSRK